MNTQCGWFEITPNVEIASVASVLNNLLTPQQGHSITLDLEQGEQIEIYGWHGNLGSDMSGGVLLCQLGQATGGGLTTLDDTTQNWPLGLFDYGVSTLVILSGTGAGKHSPITSNTATQLVFTATAGMSVDSTSRYALVIDNVGSAVVSDSNLGVFAPWQSGQYLLEYSSPWAQFFNQRWGRFVFMIDQSTITGPTIAMNQVADFVYDPKRDVFWVLDQNFTFPTQPGWLVKVKASTGEVLSRTLTPGCYGIGIGYDAGQDKLLISGLDTVPQDIFVIVDPDTLAQTTLVTTLNALMAYCPVNSLMYLGGGQVFNTATQTLVTTIAGITFNSNPFFITADNRIWYNENNTSPIKVVDPGSNTVVQTIPIAGGVRSLAYSPVTGMVYAGYAGYPPQVAVINPNTYTLDHTFTLTQATRIEWLDFRSQDGFLWAGCQTNYGEMSNVLGIDLVSEAISVQLTGPVDINKVIVGTNGQVGMISFAINRGETCFAMHKP